MAKDKPTPVYVTFYTPAYADEAGRLVRTLDLIGAEYLCRKVEDRGSWEDNVRHIPTFIRNEMLLHDGRPVVWIDADSRVRREPEVIVNQLPTQSYDFAAVWEDKKPFTSVLYFANNSVSWRLLREWERQVAEGLSLRDALDLATDAVKCHMAGLPESYRVPPSWSVLKQAVFEHVGISRLLLPSPPDDATAD